jgi:DNA segregation ATPase FtsK/SpoIIIE, S-DNA-T family
MNRTLDRQGIKEFENRILFQMSANDSSTLIDTPAASKLGENRALYFSEEENKIEKFRPYGLPELAWLEAAQRRFAARPRPAVHVQPDGEANRAAPLEVNGQSDGGANRAAPLEVNGQSDERGNGAAPLSESHAPAAPPTDDVIEPPVEAL